MSRTESVFGGKLELGPMNLHVNAELPTGFVIQPSESEMFLRGNNGVDVFMEHEKAELTTAQGGTKALDMVVTGTEARVEAGLLETDLEMLHAVMQGFNLSPASGTPEGFVFVKPIGQQDSDIATTLRGTIIDNGIESDAPLDSFFSLAAAPKGTIQYSYNAKDQRVAKIIFTCYPSEDVLFMGKPILLFGGDILSGGLVTQLS